MRILVPYFRIAVEEFEHMSRAPSVCRPAPDIRAMSCATIRQRLSYSWEIFEKILDKIWIGLCLLS